MRIGELRAVLDGAGVDPRAYSLEGGLPSEAYVIAPGAGRWEVYYSERGQRSGLETFYDEDEACARFLEQVLGDLTTRLR